MRGQESSGSCFLPHPPTPLLNLGAARQIVNMTASESLSLHLNALIEEAKIETGTKDGDFRKFLVTEDLVNVEKFGSFCSDETLLDAELIAPAKAAGCTLKTIGEKAAIKWLWTLCRRAIAKGEMMGTTLVDDGKPIATGEYKSLKTLWHDRHHFHFTSHRILSAVVMAKIFKHATASPKQFVCIFAEEMKLKSSTVKSDSGTVSLKPGEMPSAVTIDIEAVTGLGAFRDKLEALFNTWAFVSIGDFEWFSLQDAMGLMDTINGIFKQRYRGGSRPPLDFYVKCYMKTMNYFVDQICVHERKLSVVCKETASWIHVWSGWDPPQIVDKGLISATKDPDTLSPMVKSQMNRLNQMATNLAKQYQKNQYSDQTGNSKWNKKDNRFTPYPTDQFQFPPIHPHWGQGNGKGKKGKGKGKGKKGKGKGKPW